MAKIVNINDIEDFNVFYNQISYKRQFYNKEISKTVAGILLDVKQSGNSSVTSLTNRFDNRDVQNIEELKITKEDVEEAFSRTNSKIIDVLKLSMDRIHNYHSKYMPEKINTYIDDTGTELGMKWSPMNSAGVYVPGGLASYPSSVLMNVIPAKVAGVNRIVMTVPAPNGHINDVVLAAAHLAGVEEIYSIGGAQAIATLAYGTETIAPVDIIVGPGNSYVTEAKKQLFGTVGIDMIAGPSEILIVSDKSNDPKWLAADLMSQAEHDENSQSIFITDDIEYAMTVDNAVNELLQTLNRADIADKSWRNNGLIIIVNDLNESVDLINKIAPEHLELVVDNAEELAGKINNAGAIFMGKFSPEAFGDYMAGPSHVLPTSSTARFSSGLSSMTFLKRTSLIKCSQQSFNKLAEQTIVISDSEKLDAHSLSLKLRINNS